KDAEVVDGGFQPMELVEINPNSSSSREPPCAFVRLAPVGRSSDSHCISKPLAANSPQPVAQSPRQSGNFLRTPPLPLLLPFQTLPAFDRTVTVRSTFAQKSERHNRTSGCGD